MEDHLSLKNKRGGMTPTQPSKRKKVTEGIVTPIEINEDKQIVLIDISLRNAKEKAANKRMWNFFHLASYKYQHKMDLYEKSNYINLSVFLCNAF